MFKKVKKKKKEKSVIGTIVDCSMKDFEEEIKVLNRGTLISLKDSMSLLYKDLKMRVSLISSKEDISADEKKTALEGLFAEMLKIEEKVVFLTKRIEELKIQAFDSKS